MNDDSDGSGIKKIVGLRRDQDGTKTVITSPFASARYQSFLMNGRPNDLETKPAVAGQYAATFWLTWP
jgi:hypothetical protein